MKKLIGFAIIPCLLLGIILGGCGGGSGGDFTPGNISFTMPDIYFNAEEALAKFQGEGVDPAAYGMPGTSGWTVKFYTVTAANRLDSLTDQFMPDFTFTGTTGSSENFKFSLPKSLINQQRYIYMMVNMNGSFDPVGKTMDTIYHDAILKGEVLFGPATEFSTGMDKLITLSEDASITNFHIVGQITGETPAGFISFQVPSIYHRVNNGETPAIPAGKTIKFYTSTDIPGDDDSTYNADIFNTGTTSSGGSTLQFALPIDLVGQSKYIIAVVILGADLDLQGKTVAQVKNAVLNGQVLLGVTTNKDTQIEESVALAKGIVIDNIDFSGI
jgi:hypothetical protein